LTIDKRRSIARNGGCFNKVGLMNLTFGRMQAVQTIARLTRDNESVSIESVTKQGVSRETIKELESGGIVVIDDDQIALTSAGAALLQRPARGPTFGEVRG
jgi:hypothetical protein